MMQDWQKEQLKVATGVTKGVYECCKCEGAQGWRKRQIANLQCEKALAQPKREADIDLYSLLACNVEAGVFENQVAPILLDNGFGPQVIKENT